VQLYLRRLDTLESSPIRGTEEATSPFLSPDSEWLGFISTAQNRSSLYRISLRGGPRQLIARIDGGMNGADWGTDDTIVFGSTSGLFSVPAGGGTPKQLTTRDAKDGQAGHGWPSIVAANGLVLFSIGRGTDLADSSLAAVSLATGVATDLRIRGTSTRFHEPGYLTYLTPDGTLWIAPFDPATLQAGRAQPVETGVLIKPGGGRNYVVSSAGTLVYARGEAQTRLTRALTWVDRRGQALPLRTEPHGYIYPRIAPDGTRAAIEIHDGRDRDVWILDLGLEQLQRLTHEPTNDGYPVWMPDSKRVIYSVIGAVPNTVVRRQADGTGQIEQLFSMEVGGLSTYAITVGGESLILRANRGLGLLGLAQDRQMRPLLDAAEYSQSNAALSPDNRWIAYDVGDLNESDVFVSAFPDVSKGRYRISPAGGRHPVWSPAGNEIFYISREHKLMSVPVKTGATFVREAPVELFDASAFVTFPPAFFGRTYDVARTGKFLMSRDVKGGDGPDSAPEVVFVLNWLADVASRVKGK
jgi:hypothetical protein